MGCADIAIRRVLPAIGASAFRLAAVSSRDCGKAHHAAARFGCEGVAGYDSLLERDDVDVVYIPLPNSEHGYWARRALEAGKHVLIEKPAVSDEVQANSLVACADERGLLIMENFAFLRHPQFEMARALLDEGAIGELRMFSGAFGVPFTDARAIKYQRDLSGGSFWEVGCYPIRAAQEYLGSPIQVLGASVQRDPEVGVDISGAALLRDDAGIIAQCTFGLSHGYRSTYDLWGSEGRLVLEWAFTPSREARPVLRLHRQDRETRIQAPAADHFTGVLDEFHAAMDEPATRAKHHLALVRQAGLMAKVLRAAEGDAPKQPTGSRATGDGGQQAPRRR